MSSDAFLEDQNDRISERLEIFVINLKTIYPILKLNLIPGGGIAF